MQKSYLLLGFAALSICIYTALPVLVRGGGGGGDMPHRRGALPPCCLLWTHRHPPHVIYTQDCMHIHRPKHIRAISSNQHATRDRQANQLLVVAEW
jgi:hypothetical protein